MILRWQSAVSLLTCSCLISVASTPASSIGIVITTSTVQVDGQQVPTASAIFPGNIVVSGDRTASLRFADGTTTVMKPGAKVSVYRGYSVLQHGIAQQAGIDRHPVVADGLKISGATSNAVAIVGVRDSSYIEVGAQQGEAQVLAPTGELVAKVEPGKTLSFTLGQAAGTETEVDTICGELDENYLITDSSSGIAYKLVGSGLDGYRKKTIRVTGTVSGPTGGAPQTLTVTRIKQERSCAPAAATASSGGVWQGLTGLLIFVAIGGALIGVAASGGFGTSQSPVTPTTP